MNPITASRLKHIGFLLVVGVSAFALDAVVVALLWAAGVNFATLDRVEPGESGFQTMPMPASHKWLLGAVLVANAGLLWYLWAKRRRRLALAFATGAVLPMAYLVNILLVA